MRTHLPLVTVSAVSAVLAGAVLASPAQAARDHHHGAAFFNRTATYPVYLNRPAGEDPTTETVAEISAVTPDGRTLISTDAPGERLHFVDISNASAPKGLGTLSLAQDGDEDDEPTSVAAVGGYVLAVVNTSESFTKPSGRLDVIRISDRKTVRSIDLGGQPDSIAVSADQRYAAIAIENERDEEATPAGGEEGDLPQAPAGFVQIVDLRSWKATKVALTAADGKALPLLAKAAVEPTDPEPEYVSINSRDELAVSLQENNAVVTIDLAKARLTGAFSTGTASVDGIDTEDDDTIDRSGSITDLPREPDGIGWIDDRHLATANEGDWKGGTRGWTIFDTRSGKVVFDSGNTLENIAIAHGLHDDSRSDNKGVEPEGLAVATIDGTRYAFVGSERSNFVAVYDVSNPARPQYRQLLPTTNGPEGILPIPSRGLLAVSSETDDAAANVRASVALYKLGGKAPAFPTIASSSLTDPIAWGALSGLSAVPGRQDQVLSVSDSAYTPTSIYTIDTSRSPAKVVKALTVTDGGKPVGLDAEGVYARPAGGYWLAVEGATGPANTLVRLDASGAVQETVALPADVASGLGAQGFEGVTALNDKDGEHLWVAIQREVKTDPKGVVRIGRYDVSSKAWTWFGYQLETTTATGDWIGLSEITAVGKDTLAVIERDKLNGPNARIKRVYTVKVPAKDPAAGTLPVLPKKLAVDVLPALRSTNGWTQEKLEGLTVGGDGEVYAVTDNDGVQDATGETLFLRLGSAKHILGK